MQLWPFKKKQPEKLSPTEIRNRLVEAAASSDRKKIRILCDQFHVQVSENVELMCEIPDEIASDPEAVERHMQGLNLIADCLANACGAPELWIRLGDQPDAEVNAAFNRWFGDLSNRLGRLEHEAIISEARDIESKRPFRGPKSRVSEAVFRGYLGEVLFHSGRMNEAEAEFLAALKLYRQLQNAEYERIYLTNLVEVYRYQGRIDDAVRTGQELIQTVGSLGLNTEKLKEWIERIRHGEPLCRIVCVRDAEELELDQTSNISEGRYEFQFRRNRLPIQKASEYVRQGNALGTAGKLTEALEKFRAAREVDPHDPDPVYQSGVCYMELGEYAKARETFEEVERLAPGWYRCRSDQWLAKSLEAGTVTPDEFKILRVLEDGQLKAEDSVRINLKAIQTYPQFAPLYLILGDRHHEYEDDVLALLSYRKGLEYVAEPDLESRLLCAAAGLLPKDSPERTKFIQRVLSLKGSLVAQATATLLSR